MLSFLGLLGLLGLLTTASALVMDKRSGLRWGGVNLAGCDFGMDTSGNPGTPYCLTDTTQVTHFIADGANLFRVPVGWQYIVNYQETTANPSGTVFQQWTSLVQAILDQGAYAILDIHNYARWDGGIVGQGGPSNEDFSNLWGSLAGMYKSQDKVIFGLMNEPHDMPDMGAWAQSVQAAISAIRGAGATQPILVPGTMYSNPAQWTDGTNDPLLNLDDPANSLILDVHQYLDNQGGTTPNCVTDNVEDIWTPFAAWLRTNKRTALVSETGGGVNSGCITMLGNQLNYFQSNPDVFMGFAAWAAGSFDPSPGYMLGLTPDASGADNELFEQAIKPYLPE